jgi:hypothetical protein
MKGRINMGANEAKLIAIFVILGGCAAVGASISALMCWFDYWKLKKESAAEIKHLREEVKACRYLLSKRNIRDG